MQIRNTKYILKYANTKYKKKYKNMKISIDKCILEAYNKDNKRKEESKMKKDNFMASVIILAIIMCSMFAGYRIAMNVMEIKVEGTTAYCQVFGVCDKYNDVEVH